MTKPTMKSCKKKWIGNKGPWFQIFLVTLPPMKRMKNIKKGIYAAALLMGCLCALSSCESKKKENKNIITTKPVTKVKKGIQSMSDYAQSRVIEWLGNSYTVSTERKADTSLPLCKDEQGNEYYDNRITVSITRKDGSVFFKRTFTKTDFAQYAKGSYGRDGALLGVVFNTIKNDALLFAASVGSPDNMSDNFVPIVVRISRTGALWLQCP